jgi:DNA-binding NarL/FixJ family response regulator
MDAPYRIVLADPQVMFRQAIKRIIQENAGLEVVGEAGDGLELLDFLKKSPAQMVILPISMPRLGGLDAAREIKIINPGIKVLILTMYKDKECLSQAFSAGAMGYLLKNESEKELLAAIEMLRKGGAYISPLLLPQMKNFVRKESHHIGMAPPDNLTKREKDIIKLIVEGKTGTQIGRLLFISNRTVQFHRSNIMRKLKVKTSSLLIRYAIQNGYAT